MLRYEETERKWTLKSMQVLFLQDHVFFGEVQIIMEEWVALVGFINEFEAVFFRGTLKSSNLLSKFP